MNDMWVSIIEIALLLAVVIGFFVIGNELSGINANTADIAAAFYR